jgi:hypothetical protein
MQEIISKINDIMYWDGEGTPEEIFQMNNGNINAIPNAQIIDVVHKGDLATWAEFQYDVDSEEKLTNRIVGTVRKAVSDAVFLDKKKLNEFPPLANFYYYCLKLDRSGELMKKCKAMSEWAWITSINKKRLAENVSKYFSTPDEDRYNKAKHKLIEIYGFTDKDMDAFRYFVCQTLHDNHNPSLNKSLYIYGTKKQTGKTTIARSIATILNGDKFDNFGQYESTLGAEMQYNEHDLPLGAKYNAVILDESMPKDSRKAYGQIKQVLTSNSCKYNQKFGSITRVPCKRFYICTSNEPIYEFIQDRTERRFYAIEMSKRPKKLSFDEIYNLWFEFCINCSPESDWFKWYNSFDEVDGLAKKDEDDMWVEMIHLRKEIFPNGVGQTISTITSKSACKLLYKGTPTRDQEKIIKHIFESKFKSCTPPSNKFMYSITKCRDILDDAFLQLNNGDDIEVDDGMPF